MTFIWPQALWFLVLVPLLVGGYILFLRRKRKRAVRFAGLGMVKAAMGSGPPIRRHIPPLLLLLGVALLLLAMARPAAIVTLPSQRDTVVLAMDVSGSMRAGDVEPNRIVASQEAAIEFVRAQPRNTRIAVVAFAGTAMVVQSPTRDRDEVISSIERFQLQRGTNIGGALLVSLRTIFPEAEFNMGPRFTSPSERGAPLGDAPPEEPEFVPVEPGSHPYAAIVLLTDGRPTTGPDPVGVARLAADRGVRVFTVGFGSAEGETVGFGGWSMRVQLDEEVLRQIAEVTRGRYFHAEDSDALGDVYQELSAQFVLETEETEITAFFSGLATLLILLSAGLSMLWFNRIA